MIKNIDPFISKMYFFLLIHQTIRVIRNSQYRWVKFEFNYDFWSKDFDIFIL